jgi:hypothetical protein
MFAIVLSDVRTIRDELHGWRATVYPVDGYDKCHCCGDHSKPDLGCQYVESDIHKNPKDAVNQVATIAARRAERREKFGIDAKALKEFSEQIT